MSSTITWNEQYNSFLKNIYNNIFPIHYDDELKRNLQFHPSTGVLAINIKMPLLSFHPGLDEENAQVIYGIVQDAFFRKAEQLAKLYGFDGFDIIGRSGGWLVPSPAINIDMISDKLLYGFLIDSKMEAVLYSYIGYKEQIKKYLKAISQNIEDCSDVSSAEIFAAALEDA